MAEVLRSAEIESISRAVVIVFPDVRTTEEVDRSEISRNQAEFFPKLISRYKRRGFRIIGVVYQDTTPESFSPLYDFSQFDQILPLDSTKEEFSPNESPAESERVKELDIKALESMNLQAGANVVVGGFHDSACVLAMAKAIRSKGYITSIDFLLTNASSKLFWKHKDRRNGQLLDDLIPGDPYLWNWSTDYMRGQLNEK